MASPISPTTGQPVNFHTNVNRAKTKRWIEAKPIAYDGNDWGEGNEYEEPPPTGQSQHGQPPGHPQNTNPTHMFPGQRYGDLTHRQPGQPANRSATNPAPMHVRGRPSFDQGDERRAFSSTIEGYDGGFEGPYPTAQRAPFSPTDQYPQAGNNDSRMGPQRGQSPFSGRQQVRRPSMEQDSYSRAPFMPDSRSGPYPDPRNGRYAGQIPQQGRRSQSSGRPSHADLYGGRDSPSRVIPPPLSAVSNGSRDGSPGKSFPPRKSSLSQQTGPPEFTQPQPHQEQGRTDEEVAESPAEAKPLPFIRPADIYKRMAEEREKERRASEESSRPSLEDLDSQKRLKPALDPVAERKSEYGLENLIKGSEPSPRLSSTDDDNGEPAKDNDQSGHIPEESATTHKLPDRDEPPSITSETEKVRGKPSTSDGRDASAINVAESAEQVPRSDTALRHHPSAGFTSVVHQGFDDSQNKVPPTPSSVSGNSLIRSNSASASDISPVIERASSDANERPMSSSTITPTASQSFPPEESDPLPPPPPIQPGFRRESRTPSPGNSPARRPMSVATADLPREELAILSTNTPTQDKPYVPSQIPRAESPLKGTVRDLAGKIENRSPASSPVRASTPAAESPRPSSQRLESFRPSLPGGWISYTTMGTPSPIQGSTPFQSTDNLQHEPAAESASQEDDMPVAGPPKPIEQGYDVSGTAFQALAGAASALSDAFGTVTGTNQDWSENGTPTEESTTDATPASERPGGLSPVQEVPSVASNAPPTPPAKDTPYDRKTSPLGYFPSPLRTSNSAETPTPMRPQMLPALSTDNSPQDTESDRLRKEIVRSLTPKAPKVQSELQTEYKPQATPEPIEAEHSPTAHPSSSESVQQSMDKPGVKDSGHVDDIIEEVEEDAQGVDDIQAGGKARQEATEDTYDLDAVVLEKESDAGVEEEEVKEPSVKPVEVPPTRPLLQKKFSWEASTEDVEALREPTETAPGTFEPDPDTVRSPETSKAPTSCATTNLPLLSKLSNDEVTGEVKDRPTIIPVPASNENLRSDLPPPPVAKIPTEPRRSTEIEPDHEQLSTRQSLSGGPAQISTSAPASEHAQEYAAQLSVPTPIGKDISFREILSMSTAQERIKAYNSSRQQVAAQDSGLANWIQVTGSQHAEHQQLLNRNGRPLGQQADGVYSHKPSPSRSKFSGFGASPGGAGQQPNAHSNEGSKTSFGSPLAGKITTQQVQEEGKKLLQSAGKLGGKAGGAAKGLFAKGKNKFRASSGGGDKVDT